MPVDMTDWNGWSRVDNAALVSRRVAGSVVVLGVTVIGEAGDDDFTDFLALVTPGDLVDVEGILLADGVIQAEDVDFEEPEDNDGDDEDDDDDDDDEEGDDEE